MFKTYLQEIFEKNTIKNLKETLKNSYNPNVKDLIRTLFISKDLYSSGGALHYSYPPKLPDEKIKITFDPTAYTSLFDNPKIIDNLYITDALKLYNEIKDDCYGMLFIAKNSNIINPLHPLIALGVDEDFVTSCGKAIIYPKKIDNNLKYKELLINGDTSIQEQKEKLQSILSTIIKKEDIDITRSENISNLDLFQPQVCFNDIFNKNRYDVYVKLENPIRYKLYSDKPLNNILCSVGVLNDSIIYPYYGILDLNLSKEFYTSNHINLYNIKARNLTPFLSVNIDENINQHLSDFYDNLLDKSIETFDELINIAYQCLVAHTIHTNNKQLFHRIPTIINKIKNEFKFSDENSSIIQVFAFISDMKEESVSYYDNFKGILKSTFIKYLLPEPNEYKSICFGKNSFNNLTETLSRLNHCNMNSSFFFTSITTEAISFMNACIEYSLDLYKQKGII